jgi:hypothetical protein
LLIDFPFVLNNDVFIIIIHDETGVGNNVAGYEWQNVNLASKKSVFIEDDSFVLEAIDSGWDGVDPAPSYRIR